MIFIHISFVFGAGPNDSNGLLFSLSSGVTCNSIGELFVASGTKPVLNICKANVLVPVLSLSLCMIFELLHCLRGIFEVLLEIYLVYY